MTQIIRLAEAVTITPRTDIEVVRLVEAVKAHGSQIIRTVGELETLDPDALVATTFTNSAETLRILPARHLQERSLHSRLGRMVVIATGEQVRAAQQTLKEQ